MASIIKRGNSYRAQVSFGTGDKLTATFPTKREAELWAIGTEYKKGKGVDLLTRETLFSDYFEWWVFSIKQKDVKQATFQNYLFTLAIVKDMFKNLKLKNLNDVVVQNIIDEYGQSHSQKTTHEVLLKIKSGIRDAHARGYIENDFTPFVKARGYEVDKRNRALSLNEFKRLRKYVLEHSDDEFNALVLLALETGMRRGELLAIRPESLYKYGVKVTRSISPTSSDTSLKTKASKRNVSINKEVYNIIKKIPVKQDGYIFTTYGFKQSEQLAKLLKKLDIPKTTFHGLRDTHASYLFSQDIDLMYVSKRLGHSSIQTTQNYYLELMPEKKHQQDADALNLLNSL